MQNSVEISRVRFNLGVFFNAMEVTPVPEPSLLGLLSLGGLAAVVARVTRVLTNTATLKKWPSTDGLF